MSSSRGGRLAGSAAPDGVSTARLDPAPAERFNGLRAALGVGSFGINQIVLAPGQRGRIHRHKHQEEVYMVLDGTLTLVVEGEPREYTQGELVRLAPSVRRQLVNRHSAPLSLLALGGYIDHEHGPRDGEAFTSWGDAEPHTPQTVPLPDDLPPSELA
jgi:quercetin dioxygenase-like cupin family protein